MKSNSELSFEEQRLLQLDILNEIDEVCKRERIKYSLSFGTLLGAIRHKGYIPWDDDLDIMMPYEDMIRLRDVLRSDKIKFYDVETDKTYGNAFGNICSNNTYRKIGNYKERGLGIDVYPIVKIPERKEEEELFFLTAEKYNRRRRFFIKIRKFCVSHFSFCPTMLYRKSIVKFRNHLISEELSDSSKYYIIAGPLHMRERMIYNKNLFDQMISVQFEGGDYPAIADYDLFLKMRYGSYMELPPLDQRRPYHGQHYYWK